MPRKRTLDSIVTDFLLNTSRLCPQPSERHVIAAQICYTIVAGSENDKNAELIPLTTGSVAEFYIEPILSCIGDIDVMFYLNTQLAIPRGHPPPTQLPAEFHHDHVEVYEIIDSKQPGYVYLQLRYALKKCSDDGNYSVIEYGREQYASNRSCSGMTNIHGPAYILPTRNLLLTSSDRVLCVRCLSWPPQAADWPTRHRDYGWPDSATVDRVVNNGCDVVGVAHRRCRPCEWMSMYQHRLSFSRVEIVLINSWMPVQQIMYHMLRVFRKIERLTDCTDNSGAAILSNYHIKTLMLWACELKSGSWWTDDVNLVRICVQLLHILAEWLTYAQCQHYFINNCNLIDNSFNVSNIRDQLMSIDETWLSTWFVDNYIRKCLQFTPYYISPLFDDISTSIKLQTAVSAVSHWRLNNSFLDLWQMLIYAEFAIPASINDGHLTARSCAYYMTELPRIDSRLSVYFTAVTFLHVAYRSRKHRLKDELMHVLATLFGQVVCSLRHSNNSASRWWLGKAVELMKVVANKSLSTVSLIEIELSKAYLYRALRCKDSDSDSIYCLANVYLAVLYHTTGQYQTAIDHCTLETRSQDHSHCSSHVVQGEILPKIDNDIDNILGLAVFYQHVRTAVLNQKRQMQHVLVFTTELFAYYLHIKYLSVAKCRQFMHPTSVNEWKRYGISISDTPQLFIGDLLLFLSASRLLKFRHKPFCVKPQLTPVNANEYNTSDLVELLQKSAIEHLTTYRQLVARELGSVAKIVTTDFEAMYAYKRGDYQRCLQLSTQNVRALLYAGKMPGIPAFLEFMDDISRLRYRVCAFNVEILSEFLQLLDDDIVSLSALTLIVNPNCRLIVVLVNISQLTLSLYLMTQCQLKLRHSVKSLAQTLDSIKLAQLVHSPTRVLNQLILKLLERKVVAYGLTCFPSE